MIARLRPAGVACVGIITLLLGCGQAAPRPQTHIVEIRGFAFLPARLELAAGDTVVWVNQDVVPHTVTREGAADDPWDSGSIAATERWQLVASDTGSVPYVCTFHPTMRGTLVVRGSP